MAASELISEEKMGGLGALFGIVEIGTRTERALAEVSRQLSLMAAPTL